MAREIVATNAPWEYSFVGTNDAYATILSYLIGTYIGQLTLDVDFELPGIGVALGLDLSFDYTAVSPGSGDTDLVVKVPLYDGYLYFPGMTKALAGTSFDFSAKFGSAVLQFAFAADNTSITLTATNFEKSSLDLAIDNSSAPTSIRALVVGVFRVLERTVWQLLPQPPRIWAKIPIDTNPANRLSKLWAISVDGRPTQGTLSTPSTGNGPGVGLGVIGAGKYTLPVRQVSLQGAETFSAAVSSNMVMRAYILPGLSMAAQQFQQSLPMDFFKQTEQTIGWTSPDWVVCDPIAALISRKAFEKYVDTLKSLLHYDDNLQIAFRVDTSFTGTRMIVDAKFRITLHNDAYGKGSLTVGVTANYDLIFGITKNNVTGLIFNPVSILLDYHLDAEQSFFQKVLTIVSAVAIIALFVVLLILIIELFVMLLEAVALGAAVVAIFDPSLLHDLVDALEAIPDLISKISHAIDLVNFTKDGHSTDIKGIIDRINQLGILKDNLDADGLTFSFDLPTDAYLVTPTRLAFSDEVRVCGAMALSVPTPTPTPLPVPKAGMVPIYNYTVDHSSSNLYSLDPNYGEQHWGRAGRAFFAYSLAGDGLVPVYQFLKQGSASRSCWVYYLDGEHGDDKSIAFYASATQRDGFVPVRRYFYTVAGFRSGPFTYEALSVTDMPGWDRGDIVFYAPHA